VRDGTVVASVPSFGAIGAAKIWFRFLAARSAWVGISIIPKKRPSTDTNNGVVREDGRMVHSIYLFEVKKPKESKGTWNYYKLLAEVPGDQAFRSLKDRLPVSEVMEIDLEWYRLQAQQTPH